MANGFGIKLEITDHSKEALEALGEAITKGLTECGLDLERWAKKACPVGNPDKWKVKPNYPYVGGTLRNSITFALDGELPNETEYKVENEKADVPGKYDSPAPKEKGKYSRAVYLGTNVYYAPYVEIGTVKMDARPFIKPAMTEHREDLKQTLEDALRGTAGHIT